MKRIASVLIVIVALTSCLKCNAQPELMKMHSTAYCLDGITASGEPVRAGICATGHKEWLGKTVILYQRLPNDDIGEILGIFEVKDTGCKPTVIDVWFEDLDKCQEWMNNIYRDGCKGRVYCQVVEAEG